MPSSCHRCPARLPAARHLCASVIAENCCNGDQTLCKSFFACPSLPSNPNRSEQVAFPLAFSFRFPHCLLFGAATVNSQLNYAISYVHPSLAKCVPMCVCVYVCGVHYFYFTFGAGYLLGLQLHVLYIFIKLALLWLHVDNPFGLLHISLALRVTPSPTLSLTLYSVRFPCCLACHGRCLAYCTCLAPVE